MYLYHPFPYLDEITVTSVLVSSFSLLRLPSTGRPAVEINMDSVIEMRRLNYKWKKIAEMLGVCVKSKTL